MLAKAFSRLNNFINSGVENAESDQIGKRVLLANQVSILFWILGIPVLLLYLITIKEYKIVACAFPVAIFFFLIPWFNKLGYINFTRLSICVVFPLISFVLPIISKMTFKEEAIGINMYYIPRIALMLGLCFPMLLIDMSERLFMAIGIILPVILVLIFDPVDRWLGFGISQVDIHFNYYSNLNLYFLIGAIFLLSSFYYLQRANKHYESEIIGLNKTLDKRVREKTKELQETNEDLEAFSYTVSHELKTSLLAAKLVTQSIQQRGTLSGEDELNKKVRTIDECLNEMKQLIDDIMSYSQIGIQHKQENSINMKELVSEALEECSKRQVANAKFRVGNLPDARGDYGMIKVVFCNLIMNAVKYTYEEAEPLIEVEGLFKDGKAVYSVKDNGVGFDMKYVDDLFEIFKRLHSKSKYEGSGLGLAISKRIIEKHGGEMWAQGKPGEGAIFYFSLPV